MAVRKEDLQGVRRAEVIAFPTHTARARVASARRRFLLRGAFVSILVVAGTLGVVRASASSTESIASAPDAPSAVVLRPGETLWDVAERWAPTGADPRAYVDALIEQNGIGVRSGQRVILPD